MSLSKSEKNQIVQVLINSEVGQSLIHLLQQHELSPSLLTEEVKYNFKEHPAVIELENNDQKAILGKLVGQIRQSLSKAKTIASPARMVLSMDKESLGLWRQERIQRICTPISFLYKQVHHTLNLEIGHPRRRDLIWDIVNTAVNAVRYIAILGIADYIDQGIDDPHFNRILIESLRKPADGTWNMLLFAPSVGKKHSLISILSKREVNIKVFKVLSTKLSKNDFPQKACFGELAGLPNKTPNSINGLSDCFVQFRNQLVHGIYCRNRPTDDIVRTMAVLLDILIALLSPILELPVIIPIEEGVLEAIGDTIATSNKYTLDSVATKQFLNQVLYKEEKRLLSLFPWLTVSDLTLAMHRQEELESCELDSSLPELCFFNKFESNLLYYLGFAARTQLSHTNLIERAQAEEAYTVFAQYLERLRLQSAPRSAQKMDPIQRFDELASFHGENFIGREDIINEIEQFIKTRPFPIGVVRAAPGMGKSALFTHFYREYGKKTDAYGWIFHFSSRANQRDNPILGLRSLVAQAYLQTQRNTSEKLKPLALPWNYDELRQLFLEQLTKLGQCFANKGKCAVVMLDALDEQTPKPGTPPESIFNAFPDEIPLGIVVLVSVRIDKQGQDVGIESSRLRAPLACPINNANPLNGLQPSAIKTLIYKLLAKDNPKLKGVSQAVLDRIAEAAQRQENKTLDPFYIRFLADGVRVGTIDLSSIRNIPNSLGSFFDELWWGLSTDNNYLLHKILGMLSEMEAFGSDELFAETLYKSPEEIARLRFSINKLLIQSINSNGEILYGLFHDRFKWYVQRKLTQRDKAYEIHIPLLQTCQKRVSAADNYSHKYLSFHLKILSNHDGLTRDKQKEYQDQLWQTVHNDDFIEEKFSILGDENSIAEDFLRAFEVFRPKEADLEHEQFKKAGLITSLTTRSIQSIVKVSNLSRLKLHEYAKSGDVVRVIDLSHRSGGLALKWMTLLRAAKTMQENNLDPSPLFDEILVSHSKSLLPTDQAIFNQLLDNVKAPKALRNWIMKQLSP